MYRLPCCGDDPARPPGQYTLATLAEKLAALLTAIDPGRIGGWPGPAAASVPSVTTGSVVVLLDASASMHATDIRPTRFEAARTAVRDLIDGLESGARMTLILVAKQPQVLASMENDRAVLRRALENIPKDKAPSQGAANWQAAFALAAGAASDQNLNDRINHPVL